MDHRLFPVGSIVMINDMKAMVAGYTFNKSGERPVLDYLLLPYPAGYVNDDSLKRARADAVSLLGEGYRSDRGESLGVFLSSVEGFLTEHSEEELLEALMNDEETPEEVQI